MQTSLPPPQLIPGGEDMTVPCDPPVPPLLTVRRFWPGAKVAAMSRLPDGVVGGGWLASFAHMAAYAWTSSTFLGALYMGAENLGRGESLRMMTLVFVNPLIVPTPPGVTLVPL